MKDRAKLSPSEASKERNVGGAQLEIRLLGPLEVTSQGRAVQVGVRSLARFSPRSRSTPGASSPSTGCSESLWPV